MGTSTGQNSILRMVTDMSCIGMKGALLLIEGVCQEFIELDTVMDIGNLNVVGHQVQQPYFGGWYRRSGHRPRHESANENLSLCSNVSRGCRECMAVSGSYSDAPCQIE